MEGWDAIQATIYRKEGPHCEGIRISLEREIGKLREDLNIVKLRNVFLKNSCSSAYPMKDLNKNFSFLDITPNLYCHSR